MNSKCILLVVYLILCVSLPFFSNLFGSDETNSIKKSIRYDYAALDSGGKVIENSGQMYGVRGILKEDKDKYLLVPCQNTEKWVEISLLEDILIDEIRFVQGEIYSSPFKSVEVYYSVHYPTESWDLLANVTLVPSVQPQRLKVQNVWVRFLKLIFKSYYGDEFYCSLTQFSVYGTSVLQNLNEDFIIKTQEAKENIEKVPSSYILDSIGESIIEKLEEFENLYMGIRLFSNEHCIENPFLNITCDKTKNTQLTVVHNKDYQSKADFLSEIIEHIVKAEIKIRLFDQYIKYFKEIIRKLNLVVTKVEKNFNMLINEINVEKQKQESMWESNEIRINDMEGNIRELEGKYKDLKKETDALRKELNSMEFWVFFFAFFIFLGFFFVIVKLNNKLNLNLRTNVDNSLNNRMNKKNLKRKR